MGRSFARLVGIVFMLLGAWIFIINAIELDYSGTTLAWILASGLVGAIGGILFLLSFDGPSRFRTRRLRFVGWLGMLAPVLLPHSLTIFIFPLLLAAIATLPLKPARGGFSASGSKPVN